MNSLMINFEEYEYYIRPGYTDMRKGAQKLSLMVQDEMNLNPFSKSVFLFCSRSRKTVKGILWDGNGWFELTKRLDCRSGFSWPRTEEASRHITLEDIRYLLKGADVFRTFPEYYPEIAG